MLNSDSPIMLPQWILHQPRNQAAPQDKWRDAEIKTLVEFVLFHSARDKWPSHKQDSFWSCASAGLFVDKNSRATLVYVEAVRGHLQTDFSTLNVIVTLIF